MSRLHVHSALAFHGGAARVARMVGAAASRAGHEVGFSCEIQDTPEARDHDADPDAVLNAGGESAEGRRRPETPEFEMCAPRDVARKGRGVLHAHASRDWEGLLASARESGAERGIVLTLHDARLLTGGCFHPLECRSWIRACDGAGCPMGHPAARERGRNLRELLRKLKPRLVCPSSWLGRMAREALPWCECSVVPNGVEDPVMMSEQMNEVLPGPVSRDNEYAGGSFALSASAEGGLGMLKSSARKSLGIVRSAKVMLFAAHGGEKCLSKGGDKWMRIWESVKAAVPEAVGIMAGGERFERRGDLLFWPYAGRDAMNRVMLCADMFVHVSPAENHPLVLLEAFAAGVPACAFAVGGVPEQIVNGECGSLHPCGDYAGLIRSVVNALKRPPLLRKWSFAARERYERHFTVERMCAEYLKIYENLLNGQV